MYFNILYGSQASRALPALDNCQYNFFAVCWVDALVTDMQFSKVELKNS